MLKAEFDFRAEQQRRKGPLTDFQRKQRALSDTDLSLAGVGRLLRCPFCNIEPVLKSRNGSIDQGGRWLYVYCPCCGATQRQWETERWKQGFGTFYADDDAILAIVAEWNRRA